jgi:hypothetical protein
MVQRQTLRLCDIFEIAWGLPLIAGLANRDQAVGVVCIMIVLAQRQGRSMIKDDSSEHQTGAAVKTATVLS